MPPIAAPLPLPGGLILDGAPHRNVVLRDLTGHGEETLASCGASIPHRVSALVGACASVPSVDASALARAMIAGDRDAVVLAVRTRTLGGRFLLVVPCPAGHAIDVTFDASDVVIDARPLDMLEHRVRVGGRDVTFRLPAGADQEAVASLPFADAVDALFARCVLDPDGASLSPAERDAVADAMQRVAPHVAVDLELTCPECGVQWLEPFDPTAFFLRELAASAPLLLREVDAVAARYHWSEDAILSLTRPRRRAYAAFAGECAR